jgi:hypothetical protein
VQDVEEELLRCRIGHEHPGRIGEKAIAGWIESSEYISVIPLQYLLGAARHGLQEQDEEDDELDAFHEVISFLP